MTKLTQGFLVNFAIYNRVMAACLGIAAVVGIIAGGFPAWRATKISVVDGLRRGV
jgi:ABC-type antimicrobial peptide transport system permease subunit